MKKSFAGITLNSGWLARRCINVEISLSVMECSHKFSFQLRKERSVIVFDKDLRLKVETILA